MFACALCVAAQNGNCSLVQDLLLDADASTGHALLIAALYGHAECVRLLCQAGALDRLPVINEDHIQSVAALDWLNDFSIGRPLCGNGITPLLLACLQGHNACVNVLLEFGAAVDEATDDRITPLGLAALLGRADCLETLISARANVEGTSSGGTPAIAEAAATGHAACVRLLLDAGAQAECWGGDSETALCGAIEYGDAMCVEMLIEAKADCNVIDSQGRTTLILACREIPTYSAASMQKVRILLSAGLNIKINHAEQENGWTALSWALVCNRHVEIVQDLLDAGADAHYADHHGRRPMHFAEHPDHVRALLERKADVNHVDNYGNAPLHTRLVQRWGVNALTTMQCLMASGAAINLANRNGHTPLHCAALGGRSDMVQALVDAGAALEAATNDGITPLYAAALLPTNVWKGGDGRLVTDRDATESSEPSRQWSIEHRRECLYLLSSYGASRHPAGLRPLEEAMDRVGRSHIDGYSEFQAWLRASRSWSALQHVEVLTVERTRALLRGGAVVHAGSPSALERAEASSCSCDEGVRRMLRLAAHGWSPRSHHLFPEHVRTRAVVLVRLGTLLARGRYHLHADSGALIDAWLDHVVPNALP